MMPPDALSSCTPEVVQSEAEASSALPSGSGRGLPSVGSAPHGRVPGLVLVSDTCSDCRFKLEPRAGVLGASPESSWVGQLRSETSRDWPLEDLRLKVKRLQLAAADVVVTNITKQSPICNTDDTTIPTNQDDLLARHGFRSLHAPGRMLNRLTTALKAIMPPSHSISLH